MKIQRGHNTNEFSASYPSFPFGRALKFDTPFKPLPHYEADSPFFIKAFLTFSLHFPRQAISVINFTKINLEYLIFALRIAPHQEVLWTHIVVQNSIVTDKMNDIYSVIADDLLLRFVLQKSRGLRLGGHVNKTVL